MTHNPWFVPITAIRRSIGNRQHEVRRGRIGGLKVADSQVLDDSEVEADVHLDSVDGGIEVSGLIDAPWVGECRRCLKPVGGELRAEVRELYRPRPPGEPPDQDEETYPLRGELLDLRPLVRDAILLELPIAPLCRPDCAGLCPTCGADLAEGPCECPAPGADPRWAALDALLEADPGARRGGEGPGDADPGRSA
ncbi:MAG TPA: DUF177 domain-containing protein [Acidimicrobiales bacterium]|nr:DUF177 domain-containing protein [Acidimicrobiales bacterium]